MFGWVTELFQWFGSWIPRIVVVRSTQRGVKYQHGWKVLEIQPGLQVYIPALSDIEIVYTVRQVLDINPQIIVTADDKVCMFSGVAVFVIDDVVKYLTRNFDADAAIAEIAGACIREVLVDKNFKDIQSSSKVLTNQLTKAMEATLKEFGISIEYVKLKEFAPCKVIKIVRDEPKTPNTIQELL